MLRAVFDTNVYISATFGGPPEDAFQHALEGRCRLIVSPAILAELARALRLKFHAPEADIIAYVKLIGRHAEVVTPAQRIRAVEDEPDNRVLECAVTGHGNLIVSGDRHLLRLRERAGIPIVRPADFVRTIGPDRHDR